jgi:sec-independent protein translocase protein TatA
MFGSFGLPELLIVLAIVVVLFGAGRIAGVGRALGQSVRGFREEVRTEDEDGEDEDEDEQKSSETVASSETKSESKADEDSESRSD